MCSEAISLDVLRGNIPECARRQYPWMCPEAISLNVPRGNIPECARRQYPWMCSEAISLNVLGGNVPECARRQCPWMCSEERILTRKNQSALSVVGLRQQIGNFLILWLWNILCWIICYCFSAPCVSLCLFQINFNSLHSRCTHTQHVVLHKETLLVTALCYMFIRTSWCAMSSSRKLNEEQFFST
jgi:hypothetical protein